MRSWLVLTVSVALAANDDCERTEVELLPLGTMLERCSMLRQLEDVEKCMSAVLHVTGNCSDCIADVWTRMYMLPTYCHIACIPDDDDEFTMECDTCQEQIHQTIAQACSAQRPHRRG